MVGKNTSIPGLLVLKNNMHYDDRGYFIDLINSDRLSKLGFETNFFQSNLSLSKEPLTFRGMHMQINPYSQTKLVSCLKGSIIDIIVDLRKDSPSYLLEEYIVLDARDNTVVYIPKGCSHGFITLESDTIVSYFIDKPYAPEYETSFNYSSLTISNYLSIESLIMSTKDQNASWIGGLSYD